MGNKINMPSATSEDELKYALGLSAIVCEVFQLNQASQERKSTCVISLQVAPMMSALWLLVIGLSQGVDCLQGRKVEMR